MKHKKWIVIVLLAGGLLFAAYEFTHREEPLAPAGETAAFTSGPVAGVQVTPLKRGWIEETLSAFGSVVASPGEVEIFSVPFECRVRRILVTAGMEIATNAPLVEVEPSADTRLQFDQARIERDTAEQALKFAEQRMELKLATQQDLLVVRQNLGNVTARLQSMKDRGIDGLRVLHAASSGVVSRVAAQPGQIVAAGAALIETIGRNKIVAQLGVENEDVVYLTNGQPVRLSRVNTPGQPSIDGHIGTISRQVNPATRLVDLFVQPSPDARLLLNEYVEGRIVTAAHETLIAPRLAVLPEGRQFVLYTVAAGHAVKHVVTVGLESAQEVEVKAQGLAEGQPVVVQGNSQLSDGMAVKVGSKQ
jgi:RND family efflux transporter MFP subunit